MQPTDQATAPSPETFLSRRMDALERDNRRLRRLSLWSIVVLGVILGLGSALVITAARRGMPGFLPDVVESREFILRDGQGRVRGAWGMDDQGAVRLVLQDPRTLTSVKLNMLDDGSSGLTFADSTGQARLVLALLPDETVNLVFADHSGVSRTVLGTQPNGGSALLFADRGGRTRSGIGVSSRGDPLFSMGQEELLPQDAPETAPDSSPPRSPRRRP